MKVLIADKFEESGIDALREGGCDVHVHPGLQGKELEDAIARTQCAVLIVRSTKITEEMLHGAESLNLIVRAGAGYNNISFENMSRYGIPFLRSHGLESLDNLILRTLL